MAKARTRHKDSGKIHISLKLCPQIRKPSWSHASVCEEKHCIDWIIIKPLIEEPSPLCPVSCYSNRPAHKSFKADVSQGTALDQQSFRIRIA